MTLCDLKNKIFALNFNEFSVQFLLNLNLCTNHKMGISFVLVNHVIDRQTDTLKVVYKTLYVFWGVSFRLTSNRAVLKFRNGFAD